MYLRKTQRKNKDGSIVEYYALAHNERHPETGKPVAHIIHSFGRADQLDRDHLVRLCQSIARVCGLQVLDPLPNKDDDEIHSALGLPKELKLIRSLRGNAEDATSSATTPMRLTVRNIIENRKSSSLKKNSKDIPTGKPTPNGLSSFWPHPAINGI